MMRTGLDPKLNRLPPNFRRTESIDALLERWDRAAWGVFVRRLEILLLRGHTVAAQRALQAFCGWVTPVPVSLATPVHDALPTRIANCLDANGYETLETCERATDAELLELPGSAIGYFALRTIRAACEAAKEGRRLEHHVARNEPELLPEWEIDWEYLARVPTANTAPQETTITCSCSKPKENENAMTTTVATHLESFEHLLANADKAVVDIDQRIEKLEENIARLKRMRKMLAPPPPKPKKVALRDDTDISPYVTAIREALINQGRPMTCKELSERTEIPYTMIGKYVDRSPRVLTKLGRLIALQKE